MLRHSHASRLKSSQPRAEVPSVERTGVGDPFGNAKVAYGGASAEEGFPVAGNWHRKPAKERCLTAQAVIGSYTQHP